MDEQGINMDDSVKTELKQIEGRLELALQTSIQKTVKEGFRDIKEHIAELFNKDINHINGHLERHDKYHETHTSNQNKLWKAIDELKLNSNIGINDKLKPIIEEMEDIKEKQMELTITHKTEDKIEDKQDRKKELSHSKTGVIIAIASFTSGGIVYLINYLSN